jgi:predicted nucleotidyltransferase
MARGDANEASDVDLLVTLPPGVSGLALGGLLMDVQDLLGRRVDVLTEAALHPLIRDEVMSTCELL